MGDRETCSRRAKSRSPQRNTLLYRTKRKDNTTSAIKNQGMAMTTKTMDTATIRMFWIRASADIGMRLSATWFRKFLKIINYTNRKIWNTFSNYFHPNRARRCWLFFLQVSNRRNALDRQTLFEKVCREAKSKRADRSMSEGQQIISIW